MKLKMENKHFSGKMCGCMINQCLRALPMLETILVSIFLDFVSRNYLQQCNFSIIASEDTLVSLTTDLDLREDLVS
jgi:hypothetical protein